MKLLGNRVLIQLDKEVDHTKLASGIEVPKVKYEETDGGKLRAKVDRFGFLAQGTIVDASALAKKSLADEDVTIESGTKVLVNPVAVSDNYQFFQDRSTKIQLFDGLIDVPSSLIEAII